MATQKLTKSAIEGLSAAQTDYVVWMPSSPVSAFG
jgi:hypothetical protein